MYGMNYGYDLDAVMAVFGGFIAVIGLIALALLIAAIAGNWMIFRKAGRPGWGAIIPFYNDYLTADIFWGNGWLFLVLYASIWLSNIDNIIGTVFGIITLVIYAMTAYKKACAFGKGIGFAVGLFFLGPIFTCILGFGSAQYRGVPQDGFSNDEIRAKFNKNS